MSEAPHDECLDASKLAAYANEQYVNGRLMAKLGMAAFIIDEAGNMLVNRHEAVGGAFEQGALGPVMETFRYVPSRGNGITETPLEVFQRALYEELGIDDVAFEKAGLYFDRNHPVQHGEWTIGKRNGDNEVFAWAAHLIVRVRNPDVLISDVRLSEESLGVRFAPIHEVLMSNEPKRPGYDDWIQHMYRQLSLPLPAHVCKELVWADMPITGQDVLYPYSG